MRELHDTTFVAERRMWPRNSVTDD